MPRCAWQRCCEECPKHPQGAPKDLPRTPGNAPMAPNYSGAVLSISGPDPSFRDDDGSADAGVAAALQAFAAGQGSEQGALTALAAIPPPVPVLALLAAPSAQAAHVS